MADIEKYIGESTLTTTPTSKLKLQIKNGAIKPEHLSERIATEVIQPIVAEEWAGVETAGIPTALKVKLIELPTNAELQDMIDGSFTYS